MVESGGVMQSIETDQGRLFYRWCGNSQGAVLVLSHSLGASCEMWEPQLKALGERYRLLLYDHPGHGRSTNLSGEWTIERLGRLTLTLLDRLDVDRFHFCGLSLGGMIGLWLGVHAPGRLQRLVVSNTAARIADTELLAKRLELIRREGLQAIEQSVLDRWLTEEFRGREPQTVAWVRQMFGGTTVEGYINTSHAVCGFDIEDSLAEVATPTLVIAGRHDLATPLQWNASIAEQIPGARLETLDAAHLSNVEAAEAYGGAVLDFLGSKAPGSC